MGDFDYESLDVGIREIVRVAREHGFNTTDSGDGVSKPEDERVFHVPHVACSTTRDSLISEAERLADLLGAEWRIEASYCPNDGSVILLATHG